METLLTDKFIVHYGLNVPHAVVPFESTNAKYFELMDDATLIYYNVGGGIAPYKNDSALKVNVINYEAFHNTLPQAFKQNKKICDLIAYTSLVNNYFSLNELTDTNPAYINDFNNAAGQRIGKRNKAIEQLLNTLSLLSNVIDIKIFMDQFTITRCCFFNKQANPPVSPLVTITAPTTFNRVNAITAMGFEMNHSAIESLGFKLFEYSGGKVAEII